jgi:hypothetical protein
MRSASQQVSDSDYRGARNRPWNHGGSGRWSRSVGPIVYLVDYDYDNDRDHEQKQEDRVALLLAIVIVIVIVIDLNKQE